MKEDAKRIIIGIQITSRLQPGSANLSIYIKRKNHLTKVATLLHIMNNQNKKDINLEQND